MSNHFPLEGFFVFAITKRNNKAKIITRRYLFDSRNIKWQMIVLIYFLFLVIALLNFKKKYTSNQDSFGIDGDLLVRLFKMLENELIFHLYDLLSVLIY